ncbi:hypothetical protein BDV12DRAFT_181675, partial [Aspergillus spectabilis]
MEDQITPPGSFVSSFLTPPPTDGKPANNRCSILDVFEGHRRGRVSFICLSGDESGLA